MNTVAREEKKFLLNIEEYRRKSHFLDACMIQDAHNGAQGYDDRTIRHKIRIVQQSR